jgi:hypothetical protein
MFEKSPPKSSPAVDVDKSLADVTAEIKREKDNRRKSCLVTVQQALEVLRNYDRKPHA